MKSKMEPSSQAHQKQKMLINIQNQQTRNSSNDSLVLLIIFANSLIIMHFWRNH